MKDSFLLIPEPGDPNGLLDMALGQFPPPFAVLLKAGSDPEVEENDIWVLGEENDIWVLGSNADLAKDSDGNFYKTVALVLIWKGKPVIEGVNRLVSRRKDCEKHHTWHLFIDYVAEVTHDPEKLGYFLTKLSEMG